MTRIGIIICLFVLFRSTDLFSQKLSVVDSLKALIKKSNDADKIELLKLLCYEYNVTNPDKALEYAEEAMKLSVRLNNPKGLAGAYNSFGNAYYYKGNYSKTLEYYLKSLKVSEKINYEDGISASINNIGNVYYSLGDYPKALAYYSRSLKIEEIKKDTNAIAESYNNIGGVYGDLGDYEKSLKYNLKALEIREKMNNHEGIAYSLNNIGRVYSESGDYKKAIEYGKKALELYKQIGDDNGVGLSYLNIGTVYSRIGNKTGNSGNYKTAQKYYLNSLEVFKKLDYKTGIKECYKELSDISNSLKDYKAAFEYHQLYAEIKDDLINTESSTEIARMQTMYDSEKKDKKIQLLNKDKAIQATNLNKQKVIIYAAGSSLLLVIALLFFIFRGYQTKQKANLLLGEKNKLIEDKNKDITDSINYASRIQTAILPSRELIRKELKQAFVIFKPKDIVSGDFYFYAKVQQENNVPLHLIAAADCTGHGVPGAFMSMIGNDLLNQIIIEKEITKPSEILEQLHDGIRYALKQDSQDSETKDAMDVAICAINLSTKELQYAGAFRNLYIVRENALEVDEIKSDRNSVGGVKSDVKKAFTNHTINLNEGDTFYIFSDGFADQFGGPFGKKFMTKNLKKLLLEHQSESMENQEISFMSSFENWKGNLHQVDDVLLIGVRV